MTNVHHIRTKTVCQICGDGYGSEEFMLGRCCGLELIEVPWTKEDYEHERNRQEAIKMINERASKLDW
jgi:hypothetical protein